VQALEHHAHAGQHILDLVKLPGDNRISARVEGLFW
jgi:hypothetical protein